ncbi:MAG: glycosyltransferase family 39 protein, partial [Deltaproteobacteria bacterium]
MNTELIYLLPLYFGRDTLTALIHMAFGLMTAGLIYYYLKSKIDSTYALLGVLVFLSTPIAIKLSTIPYVDLALAFYSTGALLAFLVWKEGKDVKWLLLSAASAGLAAGTKYNGLYVPLILAFMILYASKNDRPLRALLIFISISIAVASPWYIKNVIQTGNPFYPLFFNIFGGLKIPEQPTVPIFLKRQLFYGENWFDILSIPVRVFFQGRDDDMQHFDGVLNPSLLLFLPFAFHRRYSDTGYLCLFSIFYFLLVFFTADMQIRFLLPILPALVILTVTGINRLMEFSKIKLLVIVAAASLLSLNLVYLANYFVKKEPLPYIAGNVSRDEYLTKHLRGYETILYINSHLPKDSKVLMVYTGDRGYYIDREYYYNSYLSGQPIKEALEGSRDGRDIAKKIRGKGVTHILLDERLLGEFMENNLDVREKGLYYDFSKGNLKELHASEGYKLYEILNPAN